MPIQPDTKIVQTDFCGQTCLKSGQRVWAFSRKAKSVEQLVEHRLDALTQVSQPSPPFFGPALFAALVRWCDHLNSQLVSPPLMRFLASKSLIGKVASLRGLARTVQPRRWLSAS